MTKQEFLEKYGSIEFFRIVFTCNDLEHLIPDDAHIDEDSINVAINKIFKGFDAGIMSDWNDVLLRSNLMVKKLSRRS